jgi:hypothetical protein
MWKSACKVRAYMRGPLILPPHILIYTGPCPRQWGYLKATVQNGFTEQALKNLNDWLYMAESGICTRPSTNPAKWTCAQCAQQTSSPHEIFCHIETRTYNKLGPKEYIANKIFRCDN